MQLSDDARQALIRAQRELADDETLWEAIQDALDQDMRVKGLLNYLRLPKFQGEENSERKDWVAVTDVFSRL